MDMTHLRRLRLQRIQGQPLLKIQAYLREVDGARLEALIGHTTTIHLLRLIQ